MEEKEEKKIFLEWRSTVDNGRQTENQQWNTFQTISSNDNRKMAGTGWWLEFEILIFLGNQFFISRNLSSVREM